MFCLQNFDCNARMKIDIAAEITNFKQTNSRRHTVNSRARVSEHSFKHSSDHYIYYYQTILSFFILLFLLPNCIQ